jgi:hypothetical protein
MDPDFPAETSWLSVERSRGAVVPDPKQKAKAFTLPRLAWKIIQPCLKPPSRIMVIMVYYGDHMVIVMAITMVIAMVIWMWVKIEDRCGTTDGKV